MCAVCRQPAAADAAFCGFCGAALARTCPSCGRVNPQEFRFCDRCGTSLGEGTVTARSKIEAQTGERRHLTVMFVDLVGSTPMSARLDPEDMRRVVRSYQARCVDVITEHDGFVANYQGDGIIAYFGFPVAHEEDTVAAVHAGLRITESMPSLASELGVDELAARVGLHTGLVVVGEMGAGAARLGADVVGETPNVAARLQGLAEPNQVVISATTLALVQGFFTVEPLGTPALKGVARPLAAYAVRAPTSAQSRLDVVRRRGLTPLVGRDEEMALLRRSWDEARRGLGRRIVITGEPGIGKSRLVLEIRRVAQADGAGVVDLRGSPRTHHSALQPVIDHVRRVIRLNDADRPDDVLQRLQKLVSQSRHPPADAVEVLAELLDVDIGREQHHVPLGPEARKRRTLDVLTALLLGLADERAALLICEDVQWFDPTTVELMAGVLYRDPPDRLLTVITRRADQPSPWPALAGAVELSLGRLETTEVDRIIERLSAGHQLPEQVHQQIAERTDGVPLFVEELTQMFLESPDAAPSSPPVSRTVPSTLRELLMARLDRQGSAAEVAQLAAVVGRETTHDFLRTIWPGDPEVLDRELERLVASGLLQQEGEGGTAVYAFKHALVQDVAYDSLLRSVRYAHHVRIAEALEQQLAMGTAVNPEDVAQHFTAGQVAERAVPFWLMAGDRALERSANEEAIAHLTTGLELLRQLPESAVRDEQELSFLVRLGAPLMATRGYGSAEAEEVYRRALALGDGLGDMTQLFEALYGIFRMHLLRAEYFIALDVADRLVGLAARAERPELTVAAGRAVGSVLVYYGDDKHEALRSLRHAIATAAANPSGRRLPALNDVADAAITSQAYASWALWLLGDNDAATAMSEAAVASARELGHPFTLALALSFDSWLRQFQGDVALVRARSEEVYEFAVAQNFGFWIGWAAIMRGWAAAAEGDPDAGAAAIRQGLVDWQATGSQLGMTYFLALLADAVARTGDRHGALELLREAVTIALEKGEAFWLPELHRHQAELLAELGESDAAAIELDEAVAVATRHGARALHARALATRDRLATSL